MHVDFDPAWPWTLSFIELHLTHDNSGLFPHLINKQYKRISSFDFQEHVPLILFLIKDWNTEF